VTQCRSENEYGKQRPAKSGKRGFASHDRRWHCFRIEPWSHPELFEPREIWVPSGAGRGRNRDGGTAKYTGLHTLRHFYASWLINRREEGGLGLTPKLVQERLGHSTIGMTFDVYGHLFPRGDDGAGLAAAEKSLLG
jgi:integrase